MRKSLQILLAFVIIGIVGVIAVSAYYNRRFTCVTYQLGSGKDSKKNADKKVRIVFITDLHSHEYGKHNEKLIQAVKKQKPDMILIGGDMFVKEEHPDMSVALAFVKEMVKIAPVYYANGNHEKKVMEIWESSIEPFREYVRELRGVGVHYLINESEKITLKRRTFEIIGLDLPLEHYGKIWNFKELALQNLQIDNQFPERTGKEDCRILLAHNPKFFETYSEADVDYVFSGHVHGGLVRLPMLGGLIAPDLTLFPKYDAGTFMQGKTTMVLSRGLGVHSIPIRMFNVPELSVIEL